MTSRKQSRRRRKRLKRPRRIRLFLLSLAFGIVVLAIGLIGGGALTGRVILSRYGLMYLIAGALVFLVQLALDFFYRFNRRKYDRRQA